MNLQDPDTQKLANGSGFKSCSNSLWCRVALFALLYFASANVGRFLTVAEFPFVSFWIPSGIYLAVLLRTKTKEWAYFSLGAVLANICFDIFNGKPLFVAIGFCLANSTEALVGAMLVRTFVTEYLILSSLRTLGVFLGYILGVAIPLGATIGAAVVISAGYSHSYIDAWRGWWSADAVAILVFCTFLLALPSQFSLPFANTFSRKRVFELCLLLSLLTLSAHYLLVSTQGIFGGYKIQLMPLIVWGALRFGILGAASINLYFSLLCAFFVSHYKVGLTPELLADGEFMVVTHRLLAISAIVSLIPAIAVAERDRLVERLRKSEERLKMFTDAAFEGIFISEDGIVTDVNEQASRIHGCSRAEIIGRPIIELIATESREIVRAAISEKREVGSQFKIVRKDGSLREVESHTKIIEDGAKVTRMSAVYDVTERNRTEENLRASQKRFFDLVNNIDGIVWEVDAKTMRFTYVSLQAERILGYPVGQWSAAGFWTEHIHPDDRHGAISYCLECSARGDAHEFEYRMIALDGREVWLRDYVNVEMENGVPLILRGIMVDITNRKAAESARQKLELMLQQSQRLESVGRLAAGIAHDFNNILGSIFAGISLLKEDTQGNTFAAEHLEQISHASNRAKQLVQQILTFSRQGEQSFEVISLAPCVEDVLRLSSRLIHRDIKVELELSPDSPQVLADATQMHQVTMNIVTNALQAMGKNSGMLTVKLSPVALDNDFLSAHPTFHSGRAVRLSVSDTGHGMSPETIKRIFEPFFTTKPVNQGTGLGLAVVYGIVKSSNGVITVQSEVGKGSTFHVILPAYEAPIQSDA